MENTKLINGVQYPVRIAHRAMVEYERLTKKPASQVETLEDATALIYCGLKAGARKSALPFSMDFEQFIDYVDENPEVLKGEEATEPAKKN